MVMRDPKAGFQLPKARLEESKKPLVSRAGLHGLLDIFDSTELGKELSACLPFEGSNRAIGNYSLSLLLIASLLSGHDSLDDIKEFEDDDLIEEMFGKIPSAKTLGNFLRRFNSEQIDRLKHFLTKMGYTLREHSKKVHPHKGEAIPHFKIDGTTHEQHGTRIEGCGWMKKSSNESVYGYASQTVFDELGFCYAGELLEAAHPRGNPEKLIDQVLRPLRGQKIDNPFQKLADISGDSAYLCEAVIRTVQAHHSTFTIAAPRTIQWEDQLDKLEWQSWDYSEEQVKKLKKRKKTPTECHVSRWHWKPGFGEGKLVFPVVIKKEWREDDVMGQACGSFHYHAVSTNRDLSKMTYQQVIELYRPRAEVENQIKEFKYNFDAKHLPCLSKSANEVYFLFVLIAQNLIRWVALLDQPDKPHYAKKIRRKLLNAPATILTGSRQFVLRVKGKFLKEVQKFQERWRSHSVIIPPLAFPVFQPGSA